MSFKTDLQTSLEEAGKDNLTMANLADALSSVIADKIDSDITSGLDSKMASYSYPIYASAESRWDLLSRLEANKDKSYIRWYVPYDSTYQYMDNVPVISPSRAVHIEAFRFNVPDSYAFYVRLYSKTGVIFDAIIHKTDSSVTWRNLSLPSLPSADGTYKLQISSGVASWVADSP